MENSIEAGTYTFHIDGSSIRISGGRADLNLNKVENNNTIKNSKFSVGVISILPKIQIAIGTKLSTFIKALEMSRSPIALQKILSNGKFETYRIIRMPTGNIPEREIATVDTYNGTIIGATYNGKLLKDQAFKRLVKLSTMHQIRLCKADSTNKLLLATKCISLLTNLSRDKLVVQETARTIRVKVVFKTNIKLPVYYIFILDDGYYRLSQIAYDYNDIVQILKVGKQ